MKIWKKIKQHKILVSLLVCGLSIIIIVSASVSAVVSQKTTSQTSASDSNQISPQNPAKNPVTPTNQTPAPDPQNPAKNPVTPTNTNTDSNSNQINPQNPTPTSDSHQNNKQETFQLLTTEQLQQQADKYRYQNYKNEISKKQIPELEKDALIIYQLFTHEIKSYLNKRYEDRKPRPMITFKEKKDAKKERTYDPYLFSFIHNSYQIYSLIKKQIGPIEFEKKAWIDKGNEQLFTSLFSLEGFFVGAETFEGNNVENIIPKALELHKSEYLNNHKDLVSYADEIKDIQTLFITKRIYRHEKIQPKLRSVYRKGKDNFKKIYKANLLSIPLETKNK